ncbi:phage tail tape measure protein [Nitratireductor sp. CH_MIT9313-5]|uniref:phage tail tape measure protein n=1 Tax=Nitratireductor sp. CH_MIT9313-5 TaxID=3107764 RepID=UPI0030081578
MSKPAAEAQVRLSLVDRITGPIRRIQARIGALSSRLGFDRIGRAAGNLTSKIGGLGDGLGRTTGRLGLFTAALGAAGGGAVFGAFKLARQTSALGDEIAKTARQLGIGAEALQEYRYAAELSGVSSETLEKGMKRFGANAADAARGTKTYAKEFDRLGISLKDAHGNVKGMDQLFNETVEAIADIESPMERTRIAMALFGRAGADMTRMFEGGAEQLRFHREEARRTGHVLGQSVTDFSEVFGDNVTRLEKRLEGIKNLIGVGLMPVMNEIVEHITAWVDANAKLIRSTIAEWVERFAQTLRDLMNPASEIRQSIAETAETFAGFIDRIRPVVDFLGGPLQASLFAVAAWVAGPLIAAIASLGAAFINLGLVILTTPVGWILTGVAAIAASVYVLYQKWDEFAAYWGNLWGRITSAFDDGFLQGMATLLAEFNPVVHIARGIDAVFEYFTGISLIEEAGALVDSFVEGVAGFASSAIEALQPGVDAAVDYVAGKASAFAAAATDIAASVGNALRSAALDVAGWFREKFDAALDYLGTLPAAFYSLGARIVSGIWDGIKAQWGNLKSWFADAVRDLMPEWTPDWLKDRLGFGDAPAPTVGADLPKVEAPSIQPIELGRVDAAGAGITEAAAGASISPPDASPQTVRTEEVQAGSVSAQTIDMPEPLQKSQTNNVDASIHIGSLVVQGAQGAPADVQAAVRRALDAESRKQSANVQSALND